MHPATRPVLTAVLVLVFSAVAPFPPAVADPGDDTTRAAHIDPTLDRIAVASSEHDAAMADLDATRATLRDQRAQREDLRERVADLARERERLEAAIERDTTVRDAADAELVVLDARLRGLALQAYVGGTDDAADRAVWALDDAAFLAARSSTTLRDAVLQTSHADYERHAGIRAEAEARIERSTAESTRAADELERTRAEAVHTEEAITRLGRDELHGLARVRDSRATALVTGTDLPLVVLDAYVVGARAANERTPGCRLHWSLLAGIGRVESGQGTHGGSVVRRDGTLTRPIHGIPLNGDNDTEVIRTSDGGFMRAEGPMQFLPSTWATVAVDGDDDGEADIQNLYDSAATAGAYLCRNGVDLSIDGDRRRAILSYNFSGAYADRVDREARRYAEAVPDLEG